MKNRILSFITILFLIIGFSEAHAFSLRDASKWLIKRGANKVLKTSTDSCAETLRHLCSKYGEPALKVIDDTGIEFVEKVASQGDELFELAMKVTPKARRSLAGDVDNLFSLTKEFGTEALELEAKSPGMSAHVFRLFGDDLGKNITRSVPAKDIPRLVRYGERADNQATRNLLMKKYKKEGSSLFDRITSSKVLSLGLTASMLYGTHRITEPMSATAKRILGIDSKDFKDLLVDTFNFFTGFFMFGLFLFIGAYSWRKGWIPSMNSKDCKLRKQTVASKKT